MTNKIMNKIFETKIIRYYFAALVFSAALLTANLVEAATLSVSPATGVHTVGSSFQVQVRLNTQGEPINAAEGTLKFDPAKLQVTGISKGSIFGLWAVEPSFSNAAGTITFGGGSPTGYTGSAGGIITIRFQAKSGGTANVSFTKGSVLAADGRGTNVLTSMGSGAFTLSAAEVPAEPEVIEYVAPANTPGTPSISSETHPNPAAWYKEKTARLSWNIPSGVTAVRTLLDSNSGSIPTKVYDSPISSITLEDLDEGVSYFHLQFQNADGWGRVAHYRLGVDSAKPTSFDISLPEDADLSNPAQTLLLDVTDETSPVTRFAVQLDGAEPFEYIDETGSSTLTLPELEPGYHTVIIEAFDAAGNSIISTFSFSILAFDKPQFTEYPSQINSEVIPVIKGITRPESAVTVSLQKIGGEVVTYDIKSDATGVFAFIPDGPLQTGVYELSAVAIDQNGAQSDPSDTIRIAVQDPGYIQIGSLIVSVLSVIVPLIGVLLLLILVLLYFFRRLKVIGRTVTKETDEALEVVGAEFEKLNKVLSEKVSALESSRKSKKLTKAEEDLVSSLKDTLNEAVRRIRKEVSDVDDIVD